MTERSGMDAKPMMDAEDLAWRLAALRERAEALLGVWRAGESLAYVAQRELFRGAHALYDRFGAWPAGPDLPW